MGFTFNKAIAAFITSAVPAYAGFAGACAGAFSIFGTSAPSAQFIAAGIVGIIAGGSVYIIGNKKA